MLLPFCSLSRLPSIPLSKPKSTSYLGGRHFSTKEEKLNPSFFKVQNLSESTLPLSAHKTFFEPESTPQRVEVKRYKEPLQNLSLLRSSDLTILNALKHPAAVTARLIENVIIKGEYSENLVTPFMCKIFSRGLSVTLFPLTLFLEFFLKRVVKAVVAYPVLNTGPHATELFNKRIRKVEKFALGLLFFPLGLRSPDGVSGLFLRMPQNGSSVRPFGVENVFGIRVPSGIRVPKTCEDVVGLVNLARKEGKKVVVLGSGMSQGTQTVPADYNTLVIDMKNLKAMHFSADNSCVTVEAGATWEEVQAEANMRGKSVIVQQASGIFSIGGSIAINCHGWAHEYGAVSSTVISLAVVKADGTITNLKPGDELFGGMFGTLGYLGVIVKATLQLTDNIFLLEKTSEVDLKDYVSTYEREIKGKDIPLFGARLPLDSLEGRKVCMVRYEKDLELIASQKGKPLVDSSFHAEPKLGKRLERISLQAAAHFSSYTVNRMTRKFWQKERATLLAGRKLTRNKAMHPPINAFNLFRKSNLHAQWLQEYFIKPQEVEKFNHFLDKLLAANDVHLLNRTIRITPKDDISILPYAEGERHAVVICFSQKKTPKAIAKTQKWMNEVVEYLIATGGVFYQAYMPYATREQFEQCYNLANIIKLRCLKEKVDPYNLFCSAHTKKYFDPLKGSPSLTAQMLIPELSVQKTSSYRAVFKTSDTLKQEFGKFLDTIFLQLDKERFFALMEEILSDQDKTDDQIYTELVEKVGSTKKCFAFLHQMRSLTVLKKGMGEQVKALMKEYKGSAFQTYMEVYDRRYKEPIQKAAKLSLKGDVIALCDSPKVGFNERLQAGTLFFRYPYTKFIPLNDEDCKNPLIEPEKTARCLTETDVAKNSVDLTVAIGGVHHWSEERLRAFLLSLVDKMSAGGLLVVRDHSILRSLTLTREQMIAMVSVIHSLVNAVAGETLQVEKKEIRNFLSQDELASLLNQCGLSMASPKAFVLKDDPSENAMMLFVKRPTNLEELRQAISYRSEEKRIGGTYATGMEWANVRSTKAFAEYLQNHPGYAFDWKGHLYQHMQHFYYYVKESIKDPEVSLSNLLFSDNMMMNLFILAATTAKYGKNYCTSIPPSFFARIKYGKKWRDVTHLSGIDKFFAANEKAYSEFIDHTPFYMYNVKITSMWKAVWGSGDSLSVKLFDSFRGVLATMGFLVARGVSAPIKWFYMSERNAEPDTVKMLIKDPLNELGVVLTRWEGNKDPAHDAKCVIEVIHETLDGYKWVSLPRYRPFTKICSYMAETEHLEIMEVANQKALSVDILLPNGKEVPELEGSRLLFKMDKLQDPEKRQYVTYQVKLAVLPHFIQLAGLNNIEYIHE